MTKEEIKRAIIKEILAIAPDIEEEEIGPDANLQRSLEIDSFDFLKVLTALNEKLGVDKEKYEAIAAIIAGEIANTNSTAPYHIAYSMADYFAQRL